MIKFNRLLFLISFSFITFFINSVENQTTAFIKLVNNSPKKGLTDFLKEASENPFFEEILIDNLKLQYSEILALPSADWVLGLKSAYVLNVNDSQTVNGFDGALSLSKLFNQSGTYLSTQFALSPGPTGDGHAQFSFDLVQPIAQNAFGRNNREIIKLAKISNEVIEIQLLEAYESYLASLIVLYYSWYSDYNTLQQSLLSYKTSEQLYNEMKKMFSYKIADKLDLNKSLVQLLSKEEKLISAKSLFKRKTVLINMASGKKKDYLCKPELTPFKELTIDDLKKMKTGFFADSRTINMLELIEDKSDMEKNISTDLLLPSADLYASYNLEGAGYGFEQGDLNHSLKLGFRLNYEILSKKVHAQIEMKEIDIKKNRLSAKNKIVELKSDLNNLIEEISNIEALINLSHKKVALSKSVADGEFSDYQLGKSGLNFLLQAINSRDSEESRLTSYIVQHNLLLVEFYRLSDSLVVELPTSNK